MDRKELVVQLDRKSVPDGYDLSAPSAKKQKKKATEDEQKDQAAPVSLLNACDKYTSYEKHFHMLKRGIDKLGKKADKLQSRAFLVKVQDCFKSLEWTKEMDLEAKNYTDTIGMPKSHEFFGLAMLMFCLRRSQSAPIFTKIEYEELEREIATLTARVDDLERNGVPQVEQLKIELASANVKCAELEEKVTRQAVPALENSKNKEETSEVQMLREKMSELQELLDVKNGVLALMDKQLAAILNEKDTLVAENVKLKIDKAEMLDKPAEKKKSTASVWFQNLLGSDSSSKVSEKEEAEGN